MTSWPRALARFASAGLILLAAGAAVADRGGYVIKSFDTELRVEADADLIVTERIDVEFSEPRHGIYRTIPVRYTDPRGYAYSLGFTLLEVRDPDGGRYASKVSNEGRYVKIRIGSAKVTVHGRRTYILSYRVRRALLHLAEHDELYWNATGHEWPTAIEAASATVRLPGEPEPAGIDAVGYTGRFGSREQAVRISPPRGGAVEFVATRPLERLEGLTVALAWPHGSVRFPGPASRTLQFLVDNWILLAPLLALGLLWRTYLRQGRDPQGPGSVMVRYEPPPGVTPGEVGTLIDEKVHVRDITASVVDLAVRGFLKIRVEERPRRFALGSTERVAFERQAKEVGDLAPHERAILNALFATGNSVEVEDLEERFYKHVPEIKRTLHDRLLERGYFTDRPPAVRRRFVLRGLLVGLAVALAGAGWAVFRGGSLPSALVVPLVAALGCVIAFAVFAPSMPSRTRKGVAVRDWALGFQEFVDRVERDRLEADRARNVFESLLPYAMALGIAAAWARRFEGIYERQPAPAWFAGVPSAEGIATRGLEQSLAAAMKQTGAGMIAAPRSQGSSGFSGGGGGGFSGGGGGGGGGGSW